ncbi:MAG: acyl-CoA/acyl-ACP dehydrogenase [Actinobacteria bacterium]|nr:acyl-CoA/acyl-ACP dehydrogenase [Actinomycetota bacterium]
MDFALTEEQQALAEVARSVLSDRCTHGHLKELESREGSVYDADLWRALAEGGVVGAVVPEEHGGSGLGLLSLLGVFEEAGRHVAPLPLMPTIVGAAALARFGSPEQRSAWLPGVVSGETLLAVALEEVGNDDLHAPSVRAERDGDSWHLHGRKTLVPYGAEADRAIVSAVSAAGPALLLAAPTDVTPQLTTNRQPHAEVIFEATPAELLVEGVEAVRWVAERGAAVLCAIQAGVCEGALRMTAEYTSNRRQFDKPIAEFQAVAQRAADAFVDTEMVRLTAWQALYRLDAELDSAAAVHTAKFWAGDGAMRVVHAAQHLHGGIGVDLDYPLHRYFVWAKQLEHTLGTPTRELIRLGAVLAE